MTDKTARQLLRLIVNGRGLQTTVVALGGIVHAAAIAEDAVMQEDEKQSPFHSAAYALYEAADRCYNEDLDGHRFTNEETEA
jgi:hypothetical protein